MNTNVRPTTGLLAATLGAALLAGCNPTSESTKSSTIDQGKLCVVTDWRHPKADTCAPGQRIAFLPNSFGNEQLPVMFAAMNCDMRYQIALTKGAVTCIFSPSNKDEAEKQESK